MKHLGMLSGREVTIHGATTYSTGKAACQALKGDDMAVISFVTNTLVDECGSALAEELDGKITDVLEKYVEVIKTIPTTVTIIIVYPYPRVEPTWVFESIGYIHKKLDDLLDTLGSHIHRFSYLSVTKDDFETDFIHLKKSICVRQFMDFCASFSNTFGGEVQVIDEFEMISPTRENLLPSNIPSVVLPDDTSLTGAVGGGFRPKLNQWEYGPPKNTQGSQRSGQGGQYPNESRKRHATGDGASNGTKTTR